MLVQIFKQVFLVLCCCSWIVSSKNLKCNNIVTQEDGYWEFTLEIPVSRRSHFVFAQVRLSWERTIRYQTTLSLERRSDLGENMIAMTYTIIPPRRIRSKPNIAEILVDTAELCILYCRDNKPEYRPNMETFDISHEFNRFRRNSPRPNCVEYKPLRSSLPEDCGRTFGGRVMEGDEIERGTWPWLVPIYVKQGMGLKFKCGGTIISSRSVLTAAHCLTDDYGRKYTDHFVTIFAGRHNLSNFNEEGYTIHTADEVILHPEYEGGHRHDIALINLKTDITFTENRRPACLWKDTAPVDGQLGTTAGWGVTQHNNPSRVPLRVKQLIISSARCKESNPAYQKLDLSSTICAGLQIGVGPCRGDSGGGLILEDSNRRFSIRGLVSQTREPEKNYMCTLRDYVLYTDVAKYNDWIREQMY